MFPLPHSAASPPPPYMFLIQLLFKADENPLWRHPPPQYIFLIQFLFKIDGIPLWCLPPPSIHISHAIPINT